MFRNISKYIFIYIIIVLFTGCQILEQSANGLLNSVHDGLEDWTSDINESFCSDDNINIQISIPEYTKDSNGYYHLDYIEGTVQTFYVLNADTNQDDITFVGWYSSEMYYVQGYEVSPINSSSYTNSNGIANQTMSLWYFCVGDTIKITAESYNECGDLSTDLIKIIVE